MVRPDAFFRAAANFSGSRPVTMLGARRRRPSKKLEIEMREIQMREIETREIGAAGVRVGDRVPLPVGRLLL